MKDMAQLYLADADEEDEDGGCLELRKLWMAISCIWCIRPSRDVTCGCTYEAVVIEDGLARPLLLNADSENGATNSRIWTPWRPPVRGTLLGGRWTYLEVLVTT